MAQLVKWVDFGILARSLLRLSPTMRTETFLPCAKCVFRPGSNSFVTAFSILFIALAASVATRAQSTFVIEAEDFNHGGGQTVSSASTMPYFGGAYNNLGAVVNVDYFEPADDGSSPEDRLGENPNVPMTQTPAMG